MALPKVMGGKSAGHDRRTTNNLGKKIQRMQQAKDPSVFLFKNLLQHVEVAEQIMDSNMASLSNQELEKVLVTLQSEEVAWPASVKGNLLKRRVAQYLESKSYLSLLPLIDPFQVAAFDPFKPALSGLEESVKQKLDYFQRTMMRDMVTPLISAGIDGEEMPAGLGTEVHPCLREH